MKWAALAWLAKRHGANGICQVAYYQRFADTEAGSTFPKCLRVRKATDLEEIAKEVWDFFSHVGRSEDLGTRLGVTVKVIEAPFTPDDRQAYQDAVREELTKANLPHPWVVFLDPDTGIAPASGAKAAHIKPAELTFYWEQVLDPGDMLAVYQHAPRKKDKKKGVEGWCAWPTGVLRKACGGAEVITLSSVPVAGDVVVLAVRKPA